jgi:RNA polymerase sigma factor (sigma-70 family)
MGPCSSGHFPLAVSIAGSFVRRRPSLESWRSDLIAVALLGAVEAEQRADHERSEQELRCYRWRTAEGLTRNYIADAVPSVRGRRGDSPPACTSLDAERPDGDRLGDVMPCDDAGPEELLGRCEEHALVRELVSQIEPPEREVVSRVYGVGRAERTTGQVARELELTPGEVDELELRALAALREQMPHID